MATQYTLLIVALSITVLAVPFLLYLIWCDMQLTRDAVWRLAEAIIAEIDARKPNVPDGTRVTFQGSGRR